MGQLRMIFDAVRHPVADIPAPEGYRVTRNGPEAAGVYAELRRQTGWGDLPRADFLERKVLPSGLILCEETASGLPVASATAESADFAEYPQFAALGQVMSLPACRGKGLGLAVCAEALRVIVAANYRYAALLTDDFRTPAIKIYLGTGWRPWLTEPDMPERWQKICAGIGWDYDTLEVFEACPERWPTGPVPATTRVLRDAETRSL